MENVEEFTTRMDHDNEKIHEIIEAAQQKMKQQADKARVLCHDYVMSIRLYVSQSST